MQDHVTLEIISQVDRVQGTLPQNIILWHTEYFKLKESEKMYMHEGLFDLLPKQVLKSSCEKCLP